MLRAFIVRPFGTKSAGSGLEVDFDKVETELISPALDAVQLAGRTTGEIITQGNIRQDMFQQLLVADVVVADITIHNANVFYELGLRHALRDRVTILLRGRSTSQGTDAVPFDLKTDRYLAYDVADPAGTHEALVDMLRASMRNEAADSPVFQLLPDMEAQDPVRFLVAPRDFRETVRLCTAQGRVADLALMSRELDHFRPDWGRVGQQIIAEALYGLGSNEASVAAWERIIDLEPSNFQANRRLATLYQRMDDLATSDLALSRMGDDLTPAMLAESSSLKGSNAKERWIRDWCDLPEDEKPLAALRSPYLEAARKYYVDAFRQDLNSYYAGLNALAMTAVLHALAELMPDVWNGFHATDAAAASGTEKLAANVRSLSAALNMALQAAEGRGDDSIWAKLTRADHALLTNDRPDYVVRCYSLALSEASARNHEAAARQIDIYLQLGLFSQVASAAAQTVAASDAKLPKRTAAADAAALVFTGHMVDAEGRATPRFPNTQSAIAMAREMIAEAVKAAQIDAGDSELVGYSGGACGGDLLFHEVCAEMGIKTWFLLAMDRREFITRSVNHGGPDWIRRFDAMYQHADREGRVLQLQDDEDLPGWLSDCAKDYSVWPRNNLWTLSFSLGYPPGAAHVIALWNKGPADGFGGTEDLIEQAHNHAIPVNILAAEKLAAPVAAE
ncbi:MAG: tetratricopeptide repeat-containing protein [Pseudomonadota bacterium]